MDFKQLRSFVTVVRLGSFTKASAYLGISQPTVSTHIRMLEEELGIPLVLRTAHHVELTPRGKRVFDQAVDVLTMYGHIVGSASERQRDTIYMGASSVPSAYILPDVLPAFVAEHPSIRFVIHQHDSQEIVSGLVEGLFDIGLVGMPSGEDAIECVPFCSDRLVLVTPATDEYRELQDGDDAEATVLRIIRGEHLILRREGSASRSVLDRILEHEGIGEETLDIIARINDQEAIKNLVESGLGVSVMSYRAVRDRVEEGRLLQFEIPCEESQRQLYVVYRKTAEMDVNTAAFLSFIRLHYAGESARELGR
jgi:DNA-binding transcriptional LysR family regulator